MDSHHFETKQLHSGRTSNPDVRSCGVPIYASASYSFESCEHGARVFDLKDFSNIYSRITNPTTEVFEKRIAALEGGLAAVSTSSGTAAIMMTIFALARSGDNIVASSNVHGGTHYQFKGFLSRLGIEARFVIGDSPVEFRKLIDSRTKCLFVESIATPAFTVPDLEKLSRIAHDACVPMIVDNTFGAGGFFCRPLDHGVDIVIHSATKWIGGHGTALGGVMVDSGRFPWNKHVDRFPQFVEGRDSLWNRFGAHAFALHCRYEILKDVGAGLDAFAAQQLLLGIETLSIRCERHAANAMDLAKWLQCHPSVAWVSYPGLENHPSHALAKKYLTRGFGGVLSFGVKGGVEESKRVVDGFKIITITANLGDVKSLALHPYSTTHQQVSGPDRPSTGVTGDMIRFSAGIEHIEDLKKDFQQSFRALGKLVESRQKQNKQADHLQQATAAGGALKCHRPRRIGVV